MKKDYVRLVVSDLHLGSITSKEEYLYNLLNNVEFDELVLAGDIIDFIKVPTFTEETAKIFNYLKSTDKKIVYVIGNHDIGLSNFAGKNVLGIDFVDKYEFVYANKKYKIVHGHQFETGVVNWRFFMNFLSVAQDYIERVFGWNLASWYVNYKLRKRKLRRIWDILKWNEEADVFIMGHTHIPEVVIWVDENEKIKTYVNCGDWVEHKTYVIIKDNQLRLKKFNLGQSTLLENQPQLSGNPSESSLSDPQETPDTPEHR